MLFRQGRIRLRRKYFNAYMLKVILDTNILIDAAQDNYAYTWRIIDLVLQNKLQAMASDKIFKEYNLIINRQVINPRDKERLEKFLTQVEVVPVFKRVQVVADDPQDNKFIECALETEADYVISFDAHLLDLEKYQHTKILKPKDFWLMYTNQVIDEDDGWKDFFKNVLGK